MSPFATLPAERRFHAAAVADNEHSDAYATVDTSTVHDSSEPPPSYMDATIAFDLDMKPKTTVPEQDTSLGDSPAQLPFDDLIGGSASRPTRRSLPMPPPQQRASPPMASPQTEQRLHSMNEADFNYFPQLPQQDPTISHPRSRPELPHAPRSAPDTRSGGRLQHITELEEVDPFGNKFHEESPFEAARRAQRVGDSTPVESTSPRGQVYMNGRMPSIKPGEIMPVNMMRPNNGRPTFFPPLEAPPFPPAVHGPIRPAHFPPNLHPPPSPTEPGIAPTRRRHTVSPPPQPSRSHSHEMTPPLPPKPTRAHSHRQPPLPAEPIRSHSHHGVPPSQPPQPTRSNSYQYAPPPIPRQHEHPLTSSPRRDGIPPGLTPSGRYPVPQPPPPSVPLPYGQPYHHPSAPPSRTSSQHSHQHPPPGRSILKDPQRHSLPAPPPSHLQFSEPSRTPVRLPSQNVPTPQSLGIVHAPPQRSDSPRSDSPRSNQSRPPRPTPKPVMPQLLAPLAAQENSLGHGGNGQLQRSASSALLSEKGGFLSKTKSILRKRNSSAGIKTHADGAISFAPQAGNQRRYENQAPLMHMPSLKEESGGSAKLGKRLSKRK